MCGLGATLDDYDRTLVAIAASLVVGWVVGLVLPVSALAGLFGGSLVATAFVYRALFVVPPLPEARRGVRAAAVAWHAVPAGLAAAAL